jgi:hypothetical protein
MVKHIWTLLLILALSLFVVRDYLAPGFPGSDDGLWAPVRLGSMYRELFREHQFPVRWSGDLNYGYGYPLFHFSYPGLYYLAALFVPFGFGLANIIKGTFILGTLLATFGIYLLIFQLTKSRLLGLAGVLLYLASPALSTNLYLRGSIGEIFAASLLPWLLLFAYQTISSSQKLYLCALAVLLGFFIISHNTTALLSLPFIFVFGFVTALAQVTHAKSPLFKIHLLFLHLRHFLLALLIGLMLAAFFWLPAITEVQATKISLSPLTYIREWFVQPSKTLFYPFFSDAGPDNLDNYHLSIGVIHTFLLIIAVFAIRNWYQRYHYLTLAGIFLAIMFLMPQSLILWQHLPLLKSIDFPWRLLAPISVVLSVALPLAFTGKYARNFLISFSLIAFLLAIPWMHKKDTVFLPDSTYATNPAIATANNEYLYHAMPNAPQNAPALRYPQELSTQILPEIQGSTLKKYQIQLTNAQEVTFAYMYFPGWQAYLDGNKIPILFTQEGQLRVSLPAGSAVLEFKFERTPIRIFAEITSAIALFTLILIAYRALKR